MNPNIEELSESSESSESESTIVEASLSRIIGEFGGELLLNDDDMIEPFICKIVLNKKMFTQSSFKAFLDISRVCGFGTYSGALLSNTKSPSRSHGDWPRCWAKQGPHWEHNNILTFLTRHFLCGFCKQNTPVLAKTITIALIFTGFCLHSKYSKSIKRA